MCQCNVLREGHTKFQKDLNLFTGKLMMVPLLHTIEVHKQIMGRKKERVERGGGGGPRNGSFLGLPKASFIHFFNSTGTCWLEDYHQQIQK